MLLAILGALGCLGLSAMFAAQLVGLLRVARLADQRPAPPARWPSLSIVVPACNEATTIEAAMRTLLSATYEPLEIIAVDDRSTDATGQILDELARAHPRLRVIHLQELPPGWLGKVNALRAGLQAACGERVLFTDADVHLGPGALEQAIALMEARDLAHLTLFPSFIANDPIVGMLMADFFDGYVSRVRTSSVEVAAAGPPFGFGAFNLVRREAFLSTEGFAWFKLDILDDLALGELMRRHGKSGFAVATREISLEFYPSAGAALQGWEKNFPGALAKYDVPKLLGAASGAFTLPFLPLAAVLQDVSPALAWAPCLPLALLVAVAAAGQLRHGRTFAHALMRPLGLLFAGYGIARAALLLQRRGGIIWRGTFYPTAELREGTRVKFP